MARQKSILKLQGTIGGISFYKSKDGYLAREKGGVDASRIANDPGFARTRENGAEFGNSASAGTHSPKVSSFQDIAIGLCYTGLSARRPEISLQDAKN